MDSGTEGRIQDIYIYIYIYLGGGQSLLNILREAWKIFYVLSMTWEAFSTSAVVVGDLAMPQILH